MADNPLLFTVDVEPDWGIAGERSVKEALPRLLRLLQKHSAAATLFTVGSLVPSHRGLLQEAAERHEIASHGYSHSRLDRMPPQDARDQLARSMEALEALGRKPVGVRAPFFRTPAGWCAMVREAGYLYDASLGECYPSRRNARPGSWTVLREDGLPRLPTCALKGGWTPFCLLHLRLMGTLGRWLTPREGRMFYCHLHELMPPDLGRGLPISVRWMLTRNAGQAGWNVLERLLAERGADTVTCAEFLGLDAPGA